MTKLTLAMLCMFLLAACREGAETEPPIQQAAPNTVTVEQDPAPISEAAPTKAAVEPEEPPEAVTEQQQEAEGAPEVEAPPTGVVKEIQLVSPERGVLQINWSAVEPTPTDYWVSWAKVGEDGSSEAETRGDAYLKERSHTIHGLEPGAHYQVRVRTRYRDQSDSDSIRLGSWSRSSSARIINPPLAPTGLRAEATHRGVMLEWDDPVDDSIIRYQLVRRLRNTGLVDRFWFDAAETSVLDARTDFDAPYDYYLHSINSDGKSPQSDFVFVRTLPEIPGRDYLYQRIQPPMAPAHVNWHWERNRHRLRELVMDFTIHSDPGDWSDRNGYFLILIASNIAGVSFYLGLQTDINGVKGIVYSRWGTRDLANARYDTDAGWTQSSGHEGDFIGVRRAYDWSVGSYRARLEPDGRDDDGEWFSGWLTNLDSGATTWVGALKFPHLNGGAAIHPHIVSTLELYGAPMEPIMAPEWHVSVKRPIGDGVPATWARTTYPYDMSANAMLNSNVRYDPENDTAHLLIGEITERQDPAAQYELE